MTHGVSHLAPRRVYIAVSKFDKVQRILDVGIERIHRDNFCRVELAGHSAAQDGKRFSADIFSELEVLKKSQAKSLKVVRRRAMFKFGIPPVNTHGTSFHG